MCEPVTIASAALQTGQIGLNYLAGSAEAKAQDARFEANAANVRKSVGLQYEASQLEQLQSNEAASRDKVENSKQALKARAAVQTNAGESGVTGLSVDALVKDVYSQEAVNADGVDQQNEFRGQQAAIDRQNIEITGRSQINSVKRGQKPSAAAALFQLGGVGLAAYSEFTKKSKPKGP